MWTTSLRPISGSGILIDDLCEPAPRGVKRTNIHREQWVYLRNYSRIA